MTINLHTSFGFDMLQLKADLLCYGIHPSEEAMGANPYFNEKGYIQGTTIFLERDSIVNVPINERFVKDYSPYYLIFDRNIQSFVIYKNKNPVALCNPVSLPPFDHNIDRRIFDFIRPHSNETLFYAPIKDCIHTSLGKKCLFCTYHGGNDGENAIKYLANIVESSGYKDIAIGGATPFLEDCGIKYFSRLIKSIKDATSLSISIEIAPPKKIELIDCLLKAGADSIIINLEIFDDNIRRVICPGKSLKDINKYIEYWRYALKVFGDNNVSSVILVGLEDIKNTLKAAEICASNGVMPTLIPFKPYDNCALNFLPPTDSDSYLSASLRVGEIINKYGLGPSLQKGCTKCGGCSLEKDISINNPRTYL